MTGAAEDEWFTEPGEGREVFRRGDRVHRTAQAWTPAVAGLMQHLEAVGFDAAPHHRGWDEAGRQVVTWLPGEDGPVSWGHLHHDRGLASVARLLRSFHDATRGHRPAPDTTWADAVGAPGPGQVVCHGDPAPWNMVWHDGEAVGLLDLDLALPAEPWHDVCYAMDWCVPFRDDETCRTFHHFPHVPDRRHRVEVFLTAYGFSPAQVAAADVAAGVAAARRRTARACAALAGRGVRPQADWVAEGHLERGEQTTVWIETHAALFERWATGLSPGRAAAGGGPAP